MKINEKMYVVELSVIFLNENTIWILSKLKMNFYLFSYDYQKLSRFFKKMVTFEYMYIWKLSHFSHIRIYPKASSITLNILVS